MVVERAGFKNYLWSIRFKKGVENVSVVIAHSQHGA